MDMHTSSLHKRAGLIGLAVVATLALIALGGPAQRAMADTDPVGCTQDVQYDPTIPTFKQWADANGVTNNTLGGTATGTTNRHPTANLNDYMDAVAGATSGNPRVKMITRQIGTTNLGRPFRYAIVGTPDNINNLDSGRNDAGFWRGVREGTIPAEEGEAQASERPAFIWLTATPHGNEPAAGEALSRLAYEMAARTDCHNQQRLQNLDTFITVVTNPDGRDNNVRTTAYGFDPNRDFASRNQDVNLYRGDEIFKYPGPIYVDAHQQSSGYFFPPNEDAVHHEVSNFSWQFIQNTIGPALQKKFNDQTSQYRNYNAYDLFAMVYGDSVPSVQLGAAGMTYEKGSSENYGKQVYDHYLALDETANIVSRDKADIMSDWSAQWEEAKEQGEQGILPQNHLVSPLNPTIIDQPPTGPSVFGYYYLPNNHSGDTAKLMRELLVTGVHVYKLDSPVNVPAAHTFGPGGYADSSPQTLPAGTLWIPSGQTNKHWIQAILGEDPFMPVAYHYDVVNWSWSLARGQSGNGYLTQAMPSAAMTEITTADLTGGVTNPGAPVLAFATDSAQGLAMVIDLARQGVTVSRSEAAFDAGGVHYPTGTALVDASTLGAVDIAATSNDRKVPVQGLASYPVSRKQLATPKIGLFTAATTVPSNPLQKGAGTGQCSGAYCEALNVLSASTGLKFPAQTVPPDAPNPNAVIYPVTTTDLNNGTFNAGGFTALINPGATISSTAPTGCTVACVTNLQAWVNAGGNYVGSDAGGLTTARNAGFTTSNTTATNVPPFNDGTPATVCPTAPSAAFDTPGVFLQGDFNATTDPVAWGFDNGGFIYRNANGNPVWDPNTLTPSDKVAASYSTPGGAFGYTCNATHVNSGDFNAANPGDRPELPGRPAIVDQAFGAGHATELGFNPWYRAWNDISWRSALNAALYPNGLSIPTGPRKAGQDDTAPAKKPTAKAKLPRVANRPAITSHDAALKDIRVVAVTGHRMKGLHRILRKSKAPSSVVSRAKFTHEYGNDVLTIRGERIADPELRQTWQLELGQRARDGGYLTNI
jgi:hypothetical protein